MTRAPVDHKRVRELLEIASNGLALSIGKVSVGRDTCVDDRCTARTLRQAADMLDPPPPPAPRLISLEEEAEF